MLNVAKNLNFKIVLCDIDYQTGFFDIDILKNKINDKTAAVVLTNMFNSYEQSIDLKQICENKNILLIEDNAIYFDNYKSLGKEKRYSGSIGDFSLYSFNIMKNISALYGGAITTDDKEFHSYGRKILSTFKSFPKIILFKQILIFFILKILSINFLYKILFFNIIKFAHTNNIKFLMKLFYPSLKFEIKQFPEYYFTNISSFSKKLIFFQLTNLKKRKDNFDVRKSNNIYYLKKFEKFNANSLRLLNISDFNYQNFIDFPILVKNRSKLNLFLLSKGIETRLHYYKNCEKIFEQNKGLCVNTEKYENEIICLPNSEKISTTYMDYIVKMISIFYSQNV
jgi:dTDP-4-amino-4,6-dideoxygalactose transaminase